MNDFLSKIITLEELNNIRAGEFNILQAPPGSGKTTLMFDDKILNFLRAKKHVLYLIHNKMVRDSIVYKHPDKAVVFENNLTSGWLEKRKGKLFTEEDEDKVHVMCYQTFAALLRNEGAKWLNDIDLIIWDEFDDIKSFYEGEVKKLKKLLPDFSRERLIALLQEGKPTSVINFVYQIKNLVLDPKKIKLLAVSATPELAATYFSDYINYIFYGQMEARYCAQEILYIHSIIDCIKDGIFYVGRKYWCYSRHVNECFRIEAMARANGFNPIVLWSEDNPDWKHLMIDERKRALKMMKEEGKVPSEYDFVIITAYGNRGIDIFDTSFQDWICNSTGYEDIIQFIRARFVFEREYRLDGSKGLVEFVQYGFPAIYYDWHSIKELRELINEKPIYSNDLTKKQLTTFNAVLKEYPALFEKRTYGRAKTTQYKIIPKVAEELDITRRKVAEGLIKQSQETDIVQLENGKSA